MRESLVWEEERKGYRENDGLTQKREREERTRNGDSNGGRDSTEVSKKRERKK